MHRKDPTNLLYVRSFYACSLLIAIIMRAVVYSKLQGAVDERRVRIKPQTKNGIDVDGRDLSVTEYDEEKMREQITQLMIVMAITGGIHYYYSAILPLIFGGIQLVLTTYESQLFQIHIMGYSDSGGESNPLRRPWSGPKTGFEDIWKKVRRMVCTYISKCVLTEVVAVPDNAVPVGFQRGWMTSSHRMRGPSVRSFLLHCSTPNLDCPLWFFPFWSL